MLKAVVASFFTFGLVNLINYRINKNWTKFHWKKFSAFEKKNFKNSDVEKLCCMKKCDFNFSIESNTLSHLFSQNTYCLYILVCISFSFSYWNWFLFFLSCLLLYRKKKNPNCHVNYRVKWILFISKWCYEKRQRQKKRKYR